MTTTKNPWSDYWQKGAKASFLDDKARLQAYQMRKFWFERMDENELKQPIVDVGTGNGIVVQWLTEYSQEKGKKLDVLGIDSAELKPFNTTLKLHAETPYETFKLPSNKKAGAFVSHFGLEYGDMQIGLENLHLQLKRGGNIIALVHSSDSNIYKNSKALFEFIPSVLKLLKKSVTPLQEALLKHGSNNLPKSALREQHNLNQFARKYERYGAFQAMNFVPATKHALQAAAQGNSDESHRVLSGYINAINEHKARLVSLLRATEQLGDTANTTELFESIGFKNVTIQTVAFPETGVVGSCVQCSK
ncbi:SAM-dependent methyltransferase [Idiomarina sp. M1R2S28]|uniref:SAM-dependent methyltransferase n=1 Tax=Idiomarina rhizosphaerae TaxID=2961572 RepID=A0A9X2FWT9_9GAMM|nr:SAM-dependent methyltransferase [Idiomarina rhizosphaerae]MCP1339977.1 SAM-dependent methyltransferase [Idiomarina rhizosphaerae]